MKVRSVPPILLIAFLVLGILACGNDQNNGGSDSPATTPTVQAPSVPSFNRDSAYNYVAQQVAFGPRVPNTEAHDLCRQYLVDKLKSFGAEVKQQKFRAEAYTGETLRGTNIIASFNPGAGKRILLGAHWDTRPFADSPVNQERKDDPVLGADDGASGVGVLLEITRQLQANPIDMGVDIVFFDAEDYGESRADNPDSWALGAQYWSRNTGYGSNAPRYGILLDMVGADGARFAREQYSVYFARPVVDKVWSLAQNMGYSNYFVNADGGGITDDHYYVNTLAKIPMIDIINRPVDTETGFGAYWHTHDDTMDVINKRTLGAVGQVVLAVLYRENAGSL
jgi:glutaminyl-peptide cyclotransferase